MDLFFISSFKTDIKVRSVGYHALDEFSFFALKETENSHSIFIVMLAIFERFCFEISEEPGELFISLIEFDADLLFELLSLVFGLFSHFPPIIMVVFYYEVRSVMICIKTTLF